MTNENMSIDVDDFVDSGIEEAGEKLQDQLEEEGSILNPEDNPPEKETEQTQEQETETPAETKKAEVNTEAEETNETSAQADSTISQLIQNTTEQRVPVEDHIKLRQRAQKANRNGMNSGRDLHSKTPNRQGEMTRKLIRLPNSMKRTL